MSPDTDTTASDTEVSNADPAPVGATWSKLRTSIVRSSDERVISGLAGGVGARLGVSTTYVRAAFVVLAFAGGVGVVLYGLGWMLASGTTPTAGIERGLEQRRALGLALMLVAVLLTFRWMGLWFGDNMVWPIGLVAFGIAAIWDRSAGSLPGGGPPLGQGPGMIRVLSGAILMLGGVAFVVGRLDAMRDLGTLVFAVAVAAAGFMLVFGPWAMRLASELATERSDRIRSEERAEVAAHLHDSVLQTLALIQRSDDRRRMVTLARSQERELRSWLYGATSETEGTLAGALQSVAGRVEQAHDVPVDVVVVNDVPMSAGLEPVVAAAAEAMHNAARHSGAGQVSVYAEAMDSFLDVYVTDQGSGFDLDDLPDDRHGLRHSIMGRMERHGGQATVHTEPGSGTEIHLSMPLEAR